MKIKKIWKLILGLGMLMFFGLSLSACGNPATQKSPTSSANQSASQSAQNTKFRLYHGAFLQANGIISTPLLADNGSQDDVMIASCNLASTLPLAVKVSGLTSFHFMLVLSCLIKT